MQRRYTDGIAANMAQEPGGAIAYLGFLALPVWYFFSGWAADLSSRGVGEAAFHLLLIGVAVLAAVIWAGASLHEIEQFGHSGRLLTAIIWWYWLILWGSSTQLTGWSEIVLLAALILFEIPLSIVERIACTYRRVGKWIKVIYQYGSVVVMFLMLSATLTSGFSAFFERGDFAWFLDDVYRLVLSVVIVEWL